MTNKQMGLYRAYNFRNCGIDIYDAYKTPSRAKVAAFKNCEADREYHNGYDQKIVSASCHFFSYAFKYMDQAGEHLRYHTARNVYDFLLSKIDQATGELIDLF